VLYEDWATEGPGRGRVMTKGEQRENGRELYKLLWHEVGYGTFREAMILVLEGMIEVGEVREKDTVEEVVEKLKRSL